jgi:hypothetical protein
MYLIISRPFDVFAVVAPVSRGAEPLGAELAVEDAAHLDAVFGVVNVRTICVILEWIECILKLEI